MKFWKYPEFEHTYIISQKNGIRVKQLEEKLEDEVKKLAGQVKLDINLEKGRAIEAVSWTIIIPFHMYI